MRTCAAALNSSTTPMSLPLRDAIDLLIEASNLLDAPEPLGEPMAVLQPDHAPRTPPTPANTIAQPCPSCGSVDARTAKRSGQGLMLTCPKCTAQFPFKPVARWQ